MRKIAHTLAMVFMVLGVIGSIALARANGITIDYESYRGITGERSIFLTVVWFAVGIFGTAVGTVILFALSEILENQEMLYRRISAVEETVEQMQKEQKN